MLAKILEEIEEATRQEDAPIYCGNMEVDGYVRMSRVEDIIRKHMNDGWIPVEKCLPEDGRDVLVTKSTGKVEMITFNKFLYEHPEYSHGVKVTAWQPLPEPYRPEKGE